MGDVRYEPALRRLGSAADPRAALRGFSDEEVIAALAASSREKDPYLANVLATEAMNRARRNVAITRHLGEGICAVNARGVITTLNPAGCRLLACEPGKLVDRDILADPLFLGDAPRPHLFERTLRGGATEEGESTFRRSDGTTFIASYVVTPVRDEDEVTGAVLLFRDVTSARELQRRLEASEERFKAALEGARDGIWDWDPVADVLYASARWREIAGVEDPRFPRRMREWIVRIHPSDRPRFESLLRAHERGLVPTFEIEHRLRQPDGSYRWALARGASVRGEDGEVRRVAGSLTDTAPRKLAERAEREESARLQIILEGAPDLLAELTPDARFVAASANTSKFFGLGPPDLRHASLYDFVAPDEVPVVAHAHLAALEGSRTARATFDVRPARGATVRVEAAMRATRLPGGPPRLVMILRPTPAPATHA